jgi:hypothetical protein
MTRRSPAATGVAQVVWALAAGDSTSPGEVAGAAERTCTELYTGLSRWIGTMGYRILFDRALALARAEHPALAGVACLGGDQPVITDIQLSPGAAEVAAGMVALVAILVELLGRIVGEEMAVRLVEQTAGEGQTGPKNEDTETELALGREPREQEGPSPRGIVNTKAAGGRDAHVG